MASSGRLGLIDPGNRLTNIIFSQAEKDITAVLATSPLLDRKPQLTFESIDVVVPVKRGGKFGVTRVTYSFSYEKNASTGERETKNLYFEYNNVTDPKGLITSFPQWKADFLEYFAGEVALIEKLEKFDATEMPETHFRIATEQIVKGKMAEQDPRRRGRSSG